MDRGVAIAGVRSARGEVPFDRRPSFDLRHDEGVADLRSSVRAHPGHYDAPMAPPPAWERSLLGDVAPAAVLDAFDGAILGRLIEVLGHLPEERLHMILIGSRGEYLCDEQVESGSDNSALSSRFRFLVERALLRGARSLILVHNHPNGDLRPTLADIDFTKHFRALCRPLDLFLADHLIVGRDSIFSMLRAGLL